MRKRLLSLAIPSALAGGSQVLALIQLALLLVGTGPGPASDAYFYIVAWIQVPWQILLLGVVYPAWVRSGTLPHERVWLASAPIASALAAIVAAVLVAHLSGPYPALPLHASLMSCLGLVSAIAWALGLRLASWGDTDWFAAITLPANLAACLALILSVDAPLDGKVTALLSGQLLGTLLFLPALIVRARRRAAQRKERAKTAEDIDPQKSPIDETAHRWFLAQSSVSQGANLVIQSQAATLPANGLSTIGVVSRVVAGLNTISTSALLPRLVHSDSDSPNPVYRFVRVMNGFGWVILAVTVVAIYAGDLAGTPLTYVVLIAPWLVASNLNVSLKRVAARFLKPSVATLSIVSATLVPVGLAVAGILGYLSLTTVFLGMILMDLLPGVMLASILRRWGLMISSTLCVAVGFTLATTLLATTAGP